jgi:4-hydroxyphenylpyruvate dioxygenase-like putative hemolysin
MPQTGFDHIAIALSRITDAAEILVGVLGGTPVFGLRRHGFSFFQWRFAGGGRIEVLEPRGDDGFVHRFLAARGPGLHHVTFTVPDLRAACDRAEAAGYTIVGYEDTTPHWAEAFLHPRQAGGIVVQLAQSSGEEMPLRWEPPAPPDPPPPVTLLGLRQSLRSRERADRQWREVLGGECAEDRDSTLTYR